MTVFIHVLPMTWSQIVAVVAWLLVMKAAVVDLDALEKITGDAVRESLMLAHITEENAADLMGMDVSALRKCLRGESRLQLGVARLMRLPFGFWLHFSPVLMYLVAKRHTQQIAEDLGLRKSA